MNSVWATTQSAVYVAMKHIFPDVPINCRLLRAAPHRPSRTAPFSIAEYPRPVAGCAAEVAQRVMEAVFGAMGQAIPERHVRRARRYQRQLRLGGYDPGEQRHYIMYFFSGGGYGGWWETDGLTNGCSTVGISKTQPVEDSRAALSDAVRGIRAARRILGGRAAPRRLRRRLSDAAAAR